MAFYCLLRTVWVTAKIDRADHHVIPEMWDPVTGAIAVQWPSHKRITYPPGSMPPIIQRREIPRGQIKPDDEAEFAAACAEATPKDDSEAEIAACFDAAVKAARGRGLAADAADILLAQSLAWKVRRMRGRPVEDPFAKYLERWMRDDMLRQLGG